MNSLLSTVSGFPHSSLVSYLPLHTRFSYTGAVRRVTRLLVLRSKRQYLTETTELHKLHVFLRLVPNARSRLCHSLQVSRHSHTLHVLQRLVLWYVFLRAAFLASFRVLCISYLFSREHAPFVHVYITLNILIG